MNNKKTGGNKPFSFIDWRISGILVALIVLYFLIIVSYGFYYFSSNPENCSRCHPLKPSVMSFKKSSHSRFECYTCHSGVGYASRVGKHLSLLKKAYLYFTGEYSKPLNSEGNLYKKIEDQVCEKCHSPLRPVTARNGIVINHKVHKQKGIQCTQCHNRVAHPLDITVRYLRSDGLSSRIPYRDGKAMISCMKCHKGGTGNPPNECIACHTEDFSVPSNCRKCHGHATEMLKPESHSAPGYANSDHEPLAKSKPAYCLRCHEKVFCDECHKKSGLKVNIPQVGKKIFHPPESHFESNFLPPLHGDQAKERGKDYCYQCHRQGFCDRCHNGLVMPHTFEFIEAHGKIVKKESYEKKCQKCHTDRNRFCETGCHHRGWNPALGPLERTHSQVVALNGVNYCYNCHTPVFCAVCHVSGVKKDMFKK